MRTLCAVANGGLYAEQRRTIRAASLRTPLQTRLQTRLRRTRAMQSEPNVLGGCALAGAIPCAVAQADAGATLEAPRRGNWSRIPLLWRTSLLLPGAQKSAGATTSSRAAPVIWRRARSAADSRPGARMERTDGARIERARLVGPDCGRERERERDATGASGSSAIRCTPPMSARKVVPGGARSPDHADRLGITSCPAPTGNQRPPPVVLCAMGAPTCAQPADQHRTPLLTRTWKNSKSPATNSRPLSRS